jgi:short-subunit dehydrogenase
VTGRPNQLGRNSPAVAQSDCANCGFWVLPDLPSVVFWGKQGPSAARVALITGASSGIGRACASHLAARGLRVYPTSRSPAMGPDPVTMLQMDVTDDQSVQRAVDAVIDGEGRLDVVVNNAGIAVAGLLELTFR